MQPRLAEKPRTEPASHVSRCWNHSLPLKPKFSNAQTFMCWFVADNSTCFKANKFSSNSAPWTSPQPGGKPRKRPACSLPTPPQPHVNSHTNAALHLSSLSSTAVFYLHLVNRCRISVPIRSSAIPPKSLPAWSPCWFPDINWFAKSICTHGTCGGPFLYATTCLPPLLFPKHSRLMVGEGWFLCLWQIPCTSCPLWLGAYSSEPVSLFLCEP